MSPRRVRSRAATRRLIAPSRAKQRFTSLRNTTLITVLLTALTRSAQPLLDSAAPALKEAISLHSPKNAPVICTSEWLRAFLHSHSPVHEAQGATWASTVSAHRITTRR